MPSIALPVSLRGQLLSGSKFSPYSLFTFGTQGIWLDPSDVANLAWRRNLLTYSEQFDNAVWTKTRTTISANAITAPDATSTADKLVEDTSTNDHWVGLGPDDVAGVAYTASVFAKAGERGFVALSWQFESPTFFNLTTGAIGTQNPNYTASITPLSDGWFRCSITRTAVSTSDFLKISVRNADGVASYTGDGTSGIYIWGAQLELGTSATDYQRISDVNTEVIERFPSATMYQDAAGTTPVTTPGQPVGLRLDKSKGLALGAETVANPGNPFVSTTGYSAGGSATISVDTGRLKVAQTTGFTDGVLCALPNNTFATSAVISFDVDLGSSTLVQVQAGNGNFGNGGVITVNITTSGTHSITTTTRNSGGAGLTFKAGSAANFFLSRVSVRELAGNHAVQSVLASRPTYGIEPAGGRRNLLTFSEEFDNAAFGKVGVTIATNTSAAPNGTTTADRIVETATTGEHLVSSVNIGTGQKTASVYFKAAERTQAAIYFFNATNGVSVSYFDLSAGTVISGAGVISDAGNGWYRCSLSRTATANDNVYFCAAVGGTTSYAGNTSSGILIWGAQLETGSTATAYQRVTSAFDVTEAGVQTCHYVQYDGSDDGMITNSIDFTATDKMSVFAGVRKLSDAAYPTVVELSSNSDTLDGSFLLSSSRSSTLSDYYFQSRGTLLGGTLASGAIPAPSSNVIVGLGDISGDRATLRVNGTQVFQSTANQGTGNYGNYPLYLGRRAGTSFPFNGRDYGILVVGKATTAAEITSTESWLAAKTGFYAPVITGVPTIGVS